MIRRVWLTIWLLLALALPMRAAVSAQTIPATLVTPTGSEYVLVYEDTGKEKKPVEVTKKEYEDLGKEGAKEPPTKPPADGKSYAWAVALELTVWSSGLFTMTPGDVGVEGETILVRLPTTVCHLDTKAYTLDTDTMTITPDPLGFTLQDGTIEVGDLVRGVPEC